MQCFYDDSAASFGLRKGRLPAMLKRRRTKDKPDKNGHNVSLKLHKILKDNSTFC